MRCIQVRQGRTADLTTLHNTMHMYIKKNINAQNESGKYMYV